MIVRVLIGLAIAGLGAFMVIKTVTIIDMFGSVEWAEAKLGGGGTNLFYKLFGIFLCIVGFMVTTNLWNAFLGATIGSWLFPGTQTP